MLTRRKFLTSGLIAGVAEISLSRTFGLEEKNRATEVVRAVYLPSGRMNSRPPLFTLLDQTEVNAAVFNLKDDGGEVNAKDRHKRWVQSLKDRGAYVIGRVVVFHDNVYAKKNPKVVLQSKGNPGEPWRDGMRWIWIDPLSEEYLEYLVKVAREGIRMGCDELNFDYIRFPSPVDGDTKDILFPLFNRSGYSKREVMRRFYEGLTKELYGQTYSGSSVLLSADIFGFVFLAGAIESIGQNLEDQAEFFDLLCPMAYPSHWDCGFFQQTDPTYAPYEVYKQTIKRGQEYLRARDRAVKIRPWIQAFSIRNICVDQKKCKPGCGTIKVVYDRAKFREQIKAIEDSGLRYGWMAWNPGAEYPLNLFNPKR